MKKTMSALLCLALLVAGAEFTFANTNNANDIDNYIRFHESKKEQVVDDVQILTNVGVPSSAITVSNVNRDDFRNDLMKYDLSYDNGIVDQAQVERLASGGIRFDFYENDIHDIVILKSDGSVLLNGEMVVFEDVEKNVVDRNITPNGRTSVYSKSPQRGRSSDYTKHVKTYSKNVRTSSLVEDLTTTTIGTLLAAALTSSLPGTVALGVVFTAATHIKSTAEVYAPKSSYFSYSIKKYAYKKNNTIDKYYKHKGRYYAKKNCVGHYYTSNFYEYNYIQ